MILIQDTDWYIISKDLRLFSKTVQKHKLVGIKKQHHIEICMDFKNIYFLHNKFRDLTEKLFKG
jgi:hypothetical protein